MKDDVFQLVLQLLKEVRKDLTLSADSRAVERVDEVIELLEACGKGEQEKVSYKDVLEAVSRIFPAIGPVAELINTIVRILR